MTLNDDTWDQTLYQGGTMLLNKTSPNPGAPNTFTPHVESVKREEVLNFIIPATIGY